jgi:hypothetical protein
MSRPLRATDVIELSDLLADAIRGAPERDWSVRAGDLEWDVMRTIEHLAGSLGKYALYLASGTTRYVPLALTRMTGEVTREDWLHGLAACARAFAGAARAAPAGTRAFHAYGMADVEGYTALACAHVLEHGRDVALGLGAGFTPPPDVCAAVSARLYPWAPAGDDPWRTFLWIVGKADLPGRSPFDQQSPPLLAPLAEWDGAVPRPPAFPVVAYVFDAATSRWTPVEQVMEC